MNILNPKVFLPRIQIWNDSPENIWKYLGEYTFYQDLSTISQDPKYHGEGTVFVHTEMVGEQLFHFFSTFTSLTLDDQKVLTIAAKLHDIGKIVCTKENARGIHHYGHDVAGAKISQYFLIHSDIPLEYRVQILQLIRYHDCFIKWTENIKDIHKFLARLSLIVNLKYLFMISQADNLGRICADKQDILDGLTLLQDEAIRLNCYEQPITLANTEAINLLYRKKLPYLEYVPYPKKDRAKVVLLSGLPGSGKSYYCKTVFPDIPVISLDNLRDEYNIRGDFDAEKELGLEGIAHNQLRGYLRIPNQQVIIDVTDLPRKTRKRWLGLAYQYDAEAEIIYFEPDLDILRKRNTEREYGVPENVIAYMLRYYLDYPEIGEAHKVRWIAT
jgi:predicted kinase